MDVVEFPDAMELGGDPMAGEQEGKKMEKKKGKGGGWQSLGLSGLVFKGVMRMGFKVPTPIQRKALPEILAGHDVVAMARTGSGKTAAFVIPLLERLREHIPDRGPRAVVMSPTRELAEQINTVILTIGKFTNLKSVCVVGGVALEQQYEALSKFPDILVATPGRLAHHIVEADLNLKTVSYAVFDEADRLFEMGFAPQLNAILKKFAHERQTCLFSATMPSALAEFTRAGLNNPSIIRLDVETKLSENLKLFFFTLRRDQKTAALLYILEHLVAKDAQTIVFASTKHHVEFLYQLLDAAEVKCTLIYGEMDSAARKINIAKFRKRLCDVLVVTDVAARGIDIPLLDNVIHYDFPSKPKLFVHRSGRVARAGRSGTGYCLVSVDEHPYMADLCVFLGHPLRNKLRTGEVYDEKNVYYGAVPSSVLEHHVSYSNTMVKMHKLEKLELTCQRAYKMYYKTRSQASVASRRRVKELGKVEIEIHPLFKNRPDLYKEPDTKLTNMISSIANYDPNKTVFEVLQQKNPVIMGIMKQKRKTHDHIIKQEKRKAKMSAYREKRDDDAPEPESMFDGKTGHENNTIMKSESSTKGEFYMTSAPANAAQESGYSVIDFSKKEGSGGGHLRVEDLVLDLDQDEMSVIRKTKLLRKWDRKKKKYMMVNPNEKNDWLQPKTDSSGRKLDNAKKKGKLTPYEQWLKTSKQSVGATGLGAGLRDIEADAEGDMGMSSSKKMRGLKRKTMGATTGGSELKSRDEIVKGRKIKARNLMRHNRSGNSGGGGGGGRNSGGPRAKSKGNGMMRGGAPVGGQRWGGDKGGGQHKRRKR